MHHSREDPKPEPIPQETEQPGGNVIRFVPRQRPVPDTTREPAQPDDDNNDPGPSAA
ncbi:hypothetical protein [Microvirga sp. TS319]|uniref:hypothetical protein n=1 Tax=Microvirga sp. TS319 TaxID=3241165 RepID=UPI00351A6B68